jgi:hypothetical protein
MRKPLGRGAKKPLSYQGYLARVAADGKWHLLAIVDAQLLN